MMTFLKHTAAHIQNALLFLVLAVTVAFSQTEGGTITGRVTDNRGAAVRDAEVSLKGSSDAKSKIVRTDRDGRFTISAAPGKYELRVATAGFSEYKQEAIVASSSTEIIIQLEPATISETITVTPARTELRLQDAPASVSVLDAEDVRTSAAQTTDDLLRQIPGFSIFRRSSSVVANPTTQGVSLRGAGASGASRTLVMSDGLPLNDAFGGLVYWDRVPRAAVDRIELVRGGSSDLYGSDALSGVINVISRPPTQRVINAEAAYGNRD